ncbi:MAG: anhydro-N-acetylmuramic acid kinase [Verrucomicrobia bacterium]|nr:anhydro-N-acetylmuramic acid kinase [Verrucomicrobiota bacterium]
MQRRYQHILGIMSGTSLDAVDFALCKFQGMKPGIELLSSWQASFPSPLRKSLWKAAGGEATSWETAQLHHDLGRFYARHAQVPEGSPRPDAAGLHGQTIFHNPARNSPATFQIGEPSYLAAKLQAPVISNFRAGDLAVGGQGAPLASMFHLNVFAQPGKHVAVQNLGGIGNLTSIDARRSGSPSILAFDTGPANMLIDRACREWTQGRLSFDRDGAWASRGRVNEPLLRTWLRHRFFARTPPKSTGREEFGDVFFSKAQADVWRRHMSDADGLATLTALTAASIANSCTAFLPSLPSRLVLCGGGARNLTLRRMLREQFERRSQSLEIITGDDLGWPVSSIEPAAFALLAWLKLQGRPGNLPETTGASCAVQLGSVT